MNYIYHFRFRAILLFNWSKWYSSKLFICLLFKTHWRDAAWDGLSFFLRVQLNYPEFLPEIDSTNQSSTLPPHSPYKTFHIRVNVQLRHAENIEASHLSSSEYFLSAGEKQPAKLLPPSLHEAPICEEAPRRTRVKVAVFE